MADTTYHLCRQTLQDSRRAQQQEEEEETRRNVKKHRLVMYCSGYCPEPVFILTNMALIVFNAVKQKENKETIKPSRATSLRTLFTTSLPKLFSASWIMVSAVCFIISWCASFSWLLNIHRHTNGLNEAIANIGKR